LILRPISFTFLHSGGGDTTRKQKLFPTLLGRIYFCICVTITNSNNSKLHLASQNVCTSNAPSLTC
jgi:hypothetical protein